MDLKAVVPHVIKVRPAAVKPVSVSPDSSGAPVLLVPVPGAPGRAGPPGAPGPPGFTRITQAAYDALADKAGLYVVTD